ncbi:hypothetical protein P22_2309 [Propionispora sp. 2/2-37]|uniref:tRNA synthetase subunit beta n=1 Tax=Propionispora sp. 2/2-37 TaxID=1677858 RepID=UPI0006BB65C0|nr:tRNA synthetase subunit beta [Propionispora sp. 2/2-37]CUH96220.1 hypothetical protein P22_2309 [Propionispora sp. 2/2-37]
MLSVTERWKQIHQGASLGLMVVKNVSSLEQYEALQDCKRDLEAVLRATFTSKEELSKSFPISVYSEYYKRYKKTYHVFQQLESIIFKGKSIPDVSPVVESMFMAELKNGLLTAGHEYAALNLPLTLDVATGNETYTLINGKKQAVKPQDMILSDAADIISSIIYGPDLRTCILPDTKDVVFIVYAPVGISRDMVINHFTDIYAYVKLASPEARIDQQHVYA